MTDEKLKEECEKLREKKKLYPGCRWPDCFHCVFDDCYEEKPMTGVDIGDVSEVLGHANTTVTKKHYAQATPETLRGIRRRAVA